jgi:hypothetical protein
MHGGKNGILPVLSTKVLFIIFFFIFFIIWCMKHNVKIKKIKKKNLVLQRAIKPNIKILVNKKSQHHGAH